MDHSSIAIQQNLYFWELKQESRQVRTEEFQGRIEHADSNFNFA